MSVAQHVLSEALPYRIRSATGNWYLARNDLDDAMACAEQQIASARDAEDSVPDDLAPRVTCLQNSRCRTVLRGPMAGGEGATCVIKIVFLPGLKRKLGFWRYGLPEATNLLRAHALGIRVPRVYGFGRVSSRWKIPMATALLMEDLTEHRAVRAELRRVDDDRAAANAVVDRVLPLFVTLYHACCNHIDMHSHNIMLPIGRAGGAPALIDFEHTAFHRFPNPETLVLQAGKFARSCQRIVPQLEMETWFLRLLDTVAIRDPIRRESLVERFHFCREHKLSIAERLHPEARAA
jgi:hypothetical protein